MNSTAHNTPATGATASRWAITGILLLAAFLRLYKLDLTSVTNATAFQELTALSAMSFEGWTWPLAGPPTEDVRSSAFLPSAIAIASVLGRHPFSGIVVVVALNLCAVALLYRLCTEQFGFRVAGIATLLYAASPWGVLYSRLLVPASCLAVFSVWLIHLSLRWLDENGKVRLATMVALAFAIPQIHFSGICAPFWLMVVLYAGRKHLSISSMVCGGLLGAVIWMPWIAFQQTTDWAELKTWTGQIVQTPEAHGHAFLQSINHLQNMLHSSNFAYWFGSGPARWPEYFPTWQRWGGWTSAVLLSAVLGASVICTITRKTEQPVRLLLWWVALPVLFGTLLRIGLNPENMLIACPIPFVLVAVMTVRLQEWLPKRIRFVPPTTVFAICVIHVALLAGWARFVDAGRTTSAGHYELSYRQRQATIRSVLDVAGSEPVLLVGAFSGWYPAYQFLLSYERAGQNNTLSPQDDPVCYWIDEEPQLSGLSDAAWTNRKERQINFTISSSLRTAPDWAINRHWSVGPSHVYRLRYVQKEALH